jgi:hypothetical protein
MRPEEGGLEDGRGLRGEVGRVRSVQRMLAVATAKNRRADFGFVMYPGHDTLHYHLAPGLPGRKLSQYTMSMKK